MQRGTPFIPRAPPLSLGHPLYPSGHPTFIPGAPPSSTGAPHLHPRAPTPQALVSLHPRMVQAGCSESGGGPCLAPTHPVQDATIGASLDSLCLHSPGLARSSGTACRHCLLQNHRHVLQPPSGILLPNPRPALSLPQPLARQPSSPSPCLPDPRLPCARCCLLPPGSGHVLSRQVSIALPVPLTCIPA